MQAIILAGGKGTRLLPYTKIFPKPLVPLGEKPIIDTILRQLKYFGFKDITIAVGYMSEMIHTYAQDGQRYGINISYCYEDKPLGTVGPLKIVESIESDFLVMNGDLITNLDYRDIYEFHRQQDSVATIGTYEKNLKIDLGIIQNDINCMVLDYIEKPTYRFNVSMGIYVFNQKILDYIEFDKYLDFPDLVKKLLDDGEKVVSYPFDGYWLDIGNHSDYERAIDEYDSIKEKLNLG